MSRRQESVWDYPRPPRVERSRRHLRVVLGEIVIADTTDSRRVLETSHPPVHYVPLADVLPGTLERSDARGSICEFKGAAVYYDVSAPGGPRVARGAWAYPKPAKGYELLLDTIAFYPAAMDECTLDGERIRAQDGDFYGGWITEEILGPFKGAPGTHGW
ncbi:MAG: DUF427 domain-containing protein [Solirubrobacterales bacterium]|nr:DUF427 domain-containing protein [Solirubrobacterales bacterium]